MKVYELFDSIAKSVSNTNPFATTTMEHPQRSESRDRNSIQNGKKTNKVNN